MSTVASAISGEQEMREIRQLSWARQA